MSEPEFSPLPMCERCRREAPCVKVETTTGERSICVAECWRLWLVMGQDLRQQVGDLLREKHADFFDEPTRPDIPTIKPPPGEKS